MKIERPNSSEDLKELEKLRTLIERAIADGVLTKYEMDTIKNFIRADNKITAEELKLCQQLVWNKIQSGELKYDWD